MDGCRLLCYNKISHNVPRPGGRGGKEQRLWRSSTAFWLLS